MAAKKENNLKIAQHQSGIEAKIIKYERDEENNEEMK